MDITKLENPFIKVTWDDIPENFTQEKIKRVRSYFQNKYNSRNVTVLTKSVDRHDNEELDIDIDDFEDMGVEEDMLYGDGDSETSDDDITMSLRKFVQNTVDSYIGQK